MTATAAFNTIIHRRHLCLVFVCQFSELSFPCPCYRIMFLRK
jgi:hypothetical protein